MSKSKTNIAFVRGEGDWLLGQMPLLRELPGIRHAVSTRQGPNGADLHVESAFGLANRRQLAAAIGAQSVAYVRQVHGDVVAEADEAMAGEVQADALMTNRAGVAVLGLSADCPIVLVADPVAGAVGMAHASWRGTVQKIAFKLIGAMARRYGGDPRNMQAVICPSAGPCCYEVQEDVVSAARQALGEDSARFFVQRDGRKFMDLWQANVAQLTQAGLCEHNVQSSGVCTICDTRFFSYRRENTSAGRFGGIIARM